MYKSSLVLWCCLVFQPCAALELNQAGEAELDGLRGIGPPFTRRLLAAREKGLFTDWQDLRARVKGIGPKLSQSLSDQGLTVNGEKFQADKSAEKITQ